MRRSFYIGQYLQGLLPYCVHAVEQFDSPIGVVFNATKNSTALVVAFYGPDPCQSYREALQSCEEQDGEGGHLNCAPFGKALQLCEVQNREID